jgi:putative tricarboxylic transport membrane protein
MIISPLLAQIALRFGPYEYGALIFFALSLVMILTGKDMVKGLISAVLGIMFGSVGLAPIDARPRFTFDQVALTGGLKLVAFLIGMFAITEVIKYAQTVRKTEEATVKDDVKLKGLGFSFKEFCRLLPNGIRSAMIGVGIGVLPGIGGGTAAMISYTVAKNQSKYPEKFGTGIPDGIVAPETANSSNIGGNMIPLLSLGIPGDVVTAVLLGGFMVHHITPGPLIFDRNPDVVYGIFLTMIIGAFMMMILAFSGLRLFLQLLKVPKNFLLAVIVIFCVVGAIGDSNFTFDVWGIVIFAFVGFFMIECGIPQVPMILGFILGPAFELHLRRASQLFQMDRLSILNSPIALVFLIITIVVFIINLNNNRKANSKLGKAE